MNAMTERPADFRQTETVATTPSAPIRHFVSDLLRGAREAILEHDGMDYRLRITNNGKLILTK